MKNLLKRLGSYVGASRTRKAAVRALALLVVFTTTYSLVLPAITKTIALADELDGVEVRVEAKESSVPDGTELILSPVLLPEDEEASVSLLSAAAEGPEVRRLTGDEVELIRQAALDGAGDYEVEILKILDISLYHNGDEIEPQDAVRLFVKSDLIREAERPAIVHLDDGGVATLLEAATEDGEARILFGEDFADEAELPEGVIRTPSGNLIMAAEDGQYILVDEDGAPLLDSNGGYIYVDENGDPAEPAGATGPAADVILAANGSYIMASGDGYIAVDENGAPLLDGDGGYIYVDENGDAVISDGTSAEPPAADENGSPIKPSETDENGNPVKSPEDGENENPDKPPVIDGNGDPIQTPEDGEDASPVETPENGEDGTSGEIPGDGEDAGPVETPEPAPAPEPEPVPAPAPDMLDVETDGFSVYAIVDLIPRTEPEEEAATMTFEAAAEDNTLVTVTAPAAAFPEGTTMTASLVAVEQVKDAVDEAVAGELGEVEIVKAVDITFYNEAGERIEPSEPISVVMKPQDIAIDTEKSQLVHIGENETAVVETASFAPDEVSFDSGEFSVYVIVIPLGEPGTQTYTGEGVTITVSYGPEANLPEGTSLVVEELEPGTDRYDEYLAKTESALNLDASVVSLEDVSLEAQFAALLGGGQKVEKVRFYDITLKHGGKEIEPAAPVTVEIKYDDAGEVGEGVQIVHFAGQADGSEKPEIITPTVEDGTIIYQQESFSVTAAAIAKSYGNAGWFNNGRMEIHYGRTKENGVPIFELAYIDGKLPGDTGFPAGAASAQFRPGTTIEEIINALNANNNYNNEFRQHCTVVDFMMHDTYVVDDANWEHNGSRVNVSEIWQGPQVGDKTIQVKITRNGGFAGPLVRVKTSWSHPLHTMNGVIIDNAANQVPGVKTAFDSSATGARYSEPVAVEIDDNGLLMMMGNSHITDSLGSGCGTGVKLVSSTGTTGGNLELFQQSYIEKMAVGVEQVCGKTRLKDAANPLGARNTVGVALAPGQSIGKWIGTISGSATPVFLRDVKSWKSGDIVMDSGYIAVNNQSVKVDVVAGDMNKLIFENARHGQTTNTRMGLEFVEGDRNEPYPVIRFRTGTVLNTRTREWYATLHDAVNGINPVMLPGESRPSTPYIQDGDVLEFYGDTYEGQNITVNNNLTIRSSTTEAGHANGYGHAQTATLTNGISITIANGKTVTFEGGTGGLTLAGGSGGTIVNNGTLHLKSGITLSGAKGAAVKQNGELHLYEGALFRGNAVDTLLVSGGSEGTNHYITLETANPNNGGVVNVKLSTGENQQFNGRDIVVAGTAIETALDGGYLAKFPLLDKEDIFQYVYNETGGPDGQRVLELKENGSGFVDVLVIDEDGKAISDVLVNLDGESFTTDKAGKTAQKKYQLTATGRKITVTVPEGYKVENQPAKKTLESTYNVVALSDGFTTAEERGEHIEIKGGNTANVTFVYKLIPKKYPLTLVKSDAQGNPLAGAKFTFSGAAEETLTSAEATGQIWTGELKAGEYTLTETAAPEGYVKSGEPVTITIASDGNVSINKEANATVAGSTVTIKNNPESVTVKLIKVETGTGKTLPGAMFKLSANGYILDDHQRTKTTDAQGEITWENVPAGVEYILKEIQAPAGYLAPIDEIKVTVMDNGDVKADGASTAVSGKLEDGVITITVGNSPGQRLPSTGGPGTAIFTAAGVSLMLGAAYLLLRLRKKDEGRA